MQSKENTEKDRKIFITRAVFEPVTSLYTAMNRAQLKHRGHLDR